MSHFVKLQLIDLPKIHIVGKALRSSMESVMTGENPLPGFWDQCFAEKIFETLEQQNSFLFAKDYLGLMCDWDRGDGDFTYIVGMLMMDGFVLPEGFVSFELPASKVAVGWIQGKDTQDVCSTAHADTEKALQEAGFTCEGMKWCSEVYTHRFNTPDENGEIILDYYIPCERQPESPNSKLEIL